MITPEQLKAILSEHFQCFYLHGYDLDGGRVTVMDIGTQLQGDAIRAQFLDIKATTERAKVVEINTDSDDSEDWKGDRD